MTLLREVLTERHGDRLGTYPGKSLAQARRTADAAGCPRDQFDAYHVAGTNGKTSTTQVIADALREAGHSVGVYSNPIVKPDRHRIRVDGEPITTDAFANVAERVLDSVNGVFTPSPYEVIVATALRHFADESVDVAVIEATTGGRLDATNVVDADVNVVTNVALDHTGMLGETREQIAVWIAGAIDEGATAVCNTTDTATEQMAREAAVKDATLVTHWEAPAFDRRNELRLSVTYRGETAETGVVGAYQRENISTAVAALESGPHAVPPAAVRRALDGLSIPGRMETVATDPLTVIDGAHNPHGVRALDRTLDSVDRDIRVVYGTVDRVDHAAMTPVVSNLAEEMYVTTPDSYGVAANKTDADPGAIGREAEQADDPAYTIRVGGPVKSTRRARETADADDLVLATGSLYLCRQIRRAFVE